MRKITCKKLESITFEKGFDEFILFCKENNYRKDSIEHYKNSYRQIEKFLPYYTPIENITSKTYKDYCLYLFDKNEYKQQTVNTYLKGFKRIINFFIEKEYIKKFTMSLPKVDQKAVQTYSDEELKKLLRKPKKDCIFTEFRDWVIINFLLSTGVRLSSLANIKIKDVDFDTSTVNISHTKNRKALIIPLNDTIISILKEYIYQRGDDPDEILFCTIWGKPLSRNSLGAAIRHYNYVRGVSTTGIHRFRHTFAKKWIINGNSVVALQKMLGHSSLDMTQKYINLLTNDLKKEVNDYNILKEFSSNYIKMKNSKK